MVGLFFTTCRYGFFFFRCSTIGQFPLGPSFWFRSCSFVDGFLRVVVFFHGMVLLWLVRTGCVSRHAFPFVHVLHVRFFFYFFTRGFAPSLGFVLGSVPFLSFSSWFSSFDVARLVLTSSTPFLFFFFFFSSSLFRFVGSFYPSSLGRGTRRGTPTPPHPTPSGPPPTPLDCCKGSVHPQPLPPSH